MRRLIVLALIALAGCNVTTTSPQSPQQRAPQTQASATSSQLNGFRRVAQRMGPVAVQMCRERTRNVNCSFQILIDKRSGQPSNAFQTLDRAGRPVIVFTTALIAEARNADELAFVIGHEAAHHIQGHLSERQARATGGAILGSILAAATGIEGIGADVLQQQGANIGARTYAKNEELEADALGTVITARAGYDPVRGANFFNRIPDPGDRFLGTHPPNAERIQTVRRVAAQL